ncbi:MAG: glutathione S-transferase family protein [Burkholderiales bacterium]|nr:MAG: glutathione S-transferase family protein [Burkholderiales bacterium]
MKIYGSKNSRSIRPVWALEEAHASYDYQRIWMMKGEGQSPAFKAVNPAGKIPVLVDGGLVLTESMAQVFYIAEKFPESNLLPSDPKARAETYRWVFYTVSEVESPLWAIAQHRFALPEDKRVPQLEPTSVWQLSRGLRVFEKMLATRQYVAGDSFTLADILATHCITWSLSAKIEAVGDACLAYVGRMKSREAYKAAVARETLEAEKQEAALAAVEPKTN